MQTGARYGEQDRRWFWCTWLWGFLTGDNNQLKKSNMKGISVYEISGYKISGCKISGYKISDYKISGYAGEEWRDGHGNPFQRCFPGFQ